MQRSGENQGVRPPLAPFDEESARQKVKMAQDAWNTRDPEKVALAYMEDSKWRNRDEFFEGREAIRELLRRKWARHSTTASKSTSGASLMTASRSASSTNHMTRTGNGGVATVMSCEMVA
jgi:hypothetical protein